MLPAFTGEKLRLRKARHLPEVRVFFFPFILTWQLKPAFFLEGEIHDANSEGHVRLPGGRRRRANILCGRADPCHRHGRAWVVGTYAPRAGRETAPSAAEPARASLPGSLFTEQLLSLGCMLEKPPWNLKLGQEN